MVAPKNFNIFSSFFFLQNLNFPRNSNLQYRDFYYFISILKIISSSQNVNFFELFQFRGRHFFSVFNLKSSTSLFQTLVSFLTRSTFAGNEDYFILVIVLFISECLHFYTFRNYDCLSPKCDFLNQNITISLNLGLGRF